MDIQKIQQYKSAFDLIAKTVKDDDDNNIEVWYARELQEVLGYAYMQFKEAMKGHNEIQTLFIITDSDSDFREMSAEFEDKRCYQLYRDYLDNFSINYERN